MKRLRDRMKDEGLRSFSMLLDIAMQTEGKIQAHNEAEIAIDKIKSELSDLELEMLKANNDLEKYKRQQMLLMVERKKCEATKEVFRAD